MRAQVRAQGGQKLAYLGGSGIVRHQKAPLAVFKAARDHLGAQTRWQQGLNAPKPLLSFPHLRHQTRELGALGEHLGQTLGAPTQAHARLGNVRIA